LEIPADAISLGFVPGKKVAVCSVDANREHYEEAVPYSSQLPSNDPSPNRHHMDAKQRRQFGYRVILFQLSLPTFENALMSRILGEDKDPGPTNTDNLLTGENWLTARKGGAGECKIGGAKSYSASIEDRAVSRTSGDSLFPALVVGSLPRPLWVREVLEDRNAGRRDQQEADRLIEPAIASAIRMQERAGLDFVSDGEWRRESGVNAR